MRHNRDMDNEWTYPPVEIPEGIKNGSQWCVVQMSGGKDSTATALVLRDLGIPFSMFFADTGWEDEITYQYLDYLRDKIGPIYTGKSDQGGMKEFILKYGMFPGGKTRWCTRELKIVPWKKYLREVEKDKDCDIVKVLGVRRNESRDRANVRSYEYDSEDDCMVWRPIAGWSAQDSISYILNSGLDINPLYREGFDRVGCFPCIYSRKEEIRLLSKIRPGRIDEIRALEQAVTAYREDNQDRFTKTVATFFKNEDGPMRIDDAVHWASYNLRKLLPIVQPSGGCYKWGVCDLPKKEDSDDD